MPSPAGGDCLQLPLERPSGRSCLRQPSPRLSNIRVSLAVTALAEPRANREGEHPCELSSSAPRAASVGASESVSRSAARSVALLARRRDRLEAAAAEAGLGDRRDRVRRHRRGVVPRGHRRSRDRARRHRRARVHACDRPAGSPGRHRRRHLAAGLRHQRHRRRDHDRGRTPLPHRVFRRRRVPLVGQRIAHTPLARPRRVHREQGRARQARGGVARSSTPTSASRGSWSATARAAKATRRPASPTDGIPTWRWSSERSGWSGA